MNRVHSRKNGDLITFKLEENLYTIGQRLESQIMRFFNITSQDGTWGNIDLNDYEVIMEVMVATTLVERLFAVNKVKNVIPHKAPCERYWLAPYSRGIDKDYPLKEGGYPYISAKLIKYENDCFNALLSPVIKEHLTVQSDREIIEKYETIIMWGTELIERLVRFFKTGVNRDDMKFELFPTLWDEREQLRPLTSRLPEQWR